MKKILCVVFALFFAVCFLTSCKGNNSTHSEDNIGPILLTSPPLCNGKTLKVLAIGNSFSDDVTNYLYAVADAQGIEDITIGRLFIGGCSLTMHVSNALTDAPAYRYGKNTKGNFEEVSGKTLLHGLQDEDWDIITIQQASPQSGVLSSYDDSLDMLIDYINENKTNPDAKIVWHMTWAYQKGSSHSAFATYDKDQMKMYEKISEATFEKVVKNDKIETVIPVGTALQNLRTSYFGDEVTRDSYHLNTLGMIVGSYTWYAMLTGQFLDEISITHVGGDLVLTEQDKKVIIECVNAAIKDPFAVTPSSYTEKE